MLEPTNNLLHELREKLHDRRGSKAAVLVGSGFSRNADPKFGTTRTFPLWEDLTTRIIERLYRDPKAARERLKTAGAISSALRLAQEFETQFGRPELIELVREATSDDGFKPSDIHESLVDLPWSDIFTTNYDRLIERATCTRSTDRLRRNLYTLVTSEADIPLSRNPRIIKLHGTLPDLSGMILTEEDFRRYEADHPLFVNAVRASLSENTLCLVGFSGDDPNFLAWSGWIRDTLGQATPNILFFCGKPLADFQTKLLLSRKMTPVALTTTFGEADFPKSLRKLLSFLEQDPATASVSWNRPPSLVSINAKNGTPFKEDSAFGDKDLVAIALKWRQNRLAYHGWQILPAESARYLWGKTQGVFHDAMGTKLTRLSGAEKLLFISESLWRLSTCRRLIFDNLASDIIEPLLETFDASVYEPDDKDECIEFAAAEERASIPKWDLRRAIVGVRCEMARHARERGDEDRFFRMFKSVENDKEVTVEELHFLKHQQILLAISQLRSEEAQHLLGQWNTDSGSPVWTIRKCGLLMELAKVDEAAVLIAKLVDGLNKLKTDKELSYESSSIEGMALHSMHYVNWWRDSKKWQDRDDARTAPVEQQNEQESESPIDGGLSTDSVKIQSPVRESNNPKEKRLSSDHVHDGDLEHRLQELKPKGCDYRSEFQELKERLRFVTLDTRPATDNDGFEVGYVNQSERSRDNQLLFECESAIRFIEDAGVPLTIHELILLNAAEDIVGIAAKVIARDSLDRATGQLCRCLNSKLVESHFDRKILASMNDSQVEKLFRQSLIDFKAALAKITVPRTKRSFLDQWHERRFKFNAALLAQLVVRLNGKCAAKLAETALPLTGEPLIWQRPGVGDAVTLLLRRTAKCLSAEIAADWIPKVLKMPVACDSGANFPLPTTNDWFDPTDELVDRAGGSLDPKAFDEPLRRTINSIKKSTKHHRENLVLRVVSLWSKGLIPDELQLAFRDALFAQVDEDGFPKDTGCFDSLILGLPSPNDVDEAQLYRDRYVNMENTPDLSYWANLARSTFRQYTSGPERRSIAWSAEELVQLLAKTGPWAAVMKEAVRKEKSLTGVLLNMMPNGPRVRNRSLREWLSFVGDTVLAEPQLDESIKLEAAKQIEVVTEAGFCVARLTPYQVQCGLLNRSEAERLIREAFVSTDPNIAWQSCSAIVQWSQFAASGTIPASRSLENLLGTSIALMAEPRLALHLEAMSELVKIEGIGLSRHLLDDLKIGFTRLINETDYAKPSKMSVERRVNIRFHATRLATQLLKNELLPDEAGTFVKLMTSDCFAEIRYEAALSGT